MAYSLRKLKLASVKYTPCILALANFVSNLFYFYRIDTTYLCFIAGGSILLMVNSIIDSYVFKFCVWHKVLIAYSVSVNIINLIDYINPMIVTTIEMINIIYTISFIFLIVTIILRFKYGCRKVENN